MTQVLAARSSATAHYTDEDAIESQIVQAKKTARASFIPQVVADKSQISIYSSQPLTAEELFSVSAVADYVAHNQNKTLASVRAVLAAKFGVDHVARIPRYHFQNAIEFLIGLRMDEMTSCK